jgi:hypothetical protein
MLIMVVEAIRFEGLLRITVVEYVYCKSDGCLMYTFRL